MVATDRELLVQCVAGDQEAWSKIVTRYERLVYSVALREGLGAEAAADVTQHTFTELVRKLESIADPERVASWLTTVARREAWRVRNAQRALGELPPETDRPSPDFEDRLLQAYEVHAAVHSLAEPCRTLILSLFFDPTEPEYSAVAALIGRPVGSIGPMRARCLERLRSALDGQAANA